MFISRDEAVERGVGRNAAPFFARAVYGVSPVGKKPGQRRGLARIS